MRVADSIFNSALVRFLFGHHLPKDLHVLISILHKYDYNHEVFNVLHMDVVISILL